MTAKPPPQHPPAITPKGPERPSTISSAELLKGKTELLIDHQGRQYRLRITAQGKLILTA